MTVNAIDIKGVGKRYGDFVMQDVSLTLPEGCVLGLVGENGAGKSTLIRMILGACRPESGSVRVLNHPADMSAAFAGVKQDIGVVLDEACLPEELTARQTGNFMKHLYARWDEAAFEGYLKAFALPQNKVIKEYSRGMKMKLAISVAMSHGARLLVLDEATSGLDPIVRDEILDLFNEFTRDETHSILLSSHIVTDLEKICDYIVFLHEGRVVMAEEKDALLEKYALLTLSEADYAALDPGAVLRVMRVHGVVRVLALREGLPDGMAIDRTGIEDIMLLLTKGEKVQ